MWWRMKRANKHRDSSANPASRRLLTMREVVVHTTFSRPSVYRLLAMGDFPTPVKIGRHRIAFYADEIDHWIASRQRVSLNTDAKQPSDDKHSTEGRS